MDKMALRQLANAIEQECMTYDGTKVGFYMGDWHVPTSRLAIDRSKYKGCGTVACIAGHADILFADRRYALGLDGEDAANLFTNSQGIGLVNLKREHAIYHLRRLILTGEVSWKHAFHEYNNGKRLTDDDVKACTQGLPQAALKALK